MTFDTDDLARESANAFARQLTAAIHKRFDTRVFGVYLLGSLAHGGFGRRYSDLDMALIVMGGLKDHELSDIRAAAAELSPAWAARLSVFWSDPNFVVGRFPPLDRIDYLDHAVTLVERQRSTPPRPTLDEIRTYLAGAPFAGWFASARQFAEKSELGSNEHKSYLRTLLYPARFIMSWRTGRIASNDEAVAFLRTAVPTGLDIDIVERALECRRRAEDPIGLWQDRNILPQHIDVCQRLANENIT